MIRSWTDWDLSDVGIEQANRIGERLSREIKGEKYVMYSSDLLRAKHTAEIIAGYLGIKPNITEAIKEQNLGEACGESEEWAHKNTIVWMKTIDDKPFVGCESKREVWHRLAPFHNQIVEGKDENLILVSHGGTLRMFHAMWLGLDVEMLNKCDLACSSGGVSFMHEDSDGKRIISRLNDRSYVSC